MSSRNLTDKPLIEGSSMRKTAANEVKAPAPFNTIRFSVFLAGAIDMGQAEDWQAKVARSLDDLDITILKWEIKAQEEADLVIFVFTKDSKAPITFFEMGAFATTKDSVVCVEEGFYRQGNVDIYCEHWGIPVYHNLDEMITDLRGYLAAYKEG